MLAYNTRIAIKSLRRHPVLSAIIVAGIALGICASTTFTTVRHMFARDPLPGRSQNLFFVRMDNWDPAHSYPDGGDFPNPHKVPPTLTYRDSVELLRSKIPVRQAAMFLTTLAIFPERSISRPFTSDVRVTTSDLFAMFNVPFHYGGPWDRRADEKAEQVVVIDDATNQKVFGGGNNVGKRLQIGERQFTVVGILAPWRPFVRVYDLTRSFVGAPEPIFIPFSLTPGMQLRTTGNSDGWKSLPPNATFEQILASDIDYVVFWAELRSPADRARYQQYLDEYVREQKKSGRFPRPLNNVIVSLRELLAEMGVVRPQMTAMAVISILFLAVCALNLTGLVLGKFLARAPEVSVRRALGATRGDIFLQHIVECEIVGIVGGTIGMILSVAALAAVGKMSDRMGAMTLDLEMIAAAVFLSLVAGLLAGLYPAWRICNVQPAVQLKL
jgi:putative ABC transport system permease protein